jgi:hypothetical protein
MAVVASGGPTRWNVIPQLDNGRAIGRLAVEKGDRKEKNASEEAAHELNKQPAKRDSNCLVLGAASEPNLLVGPLA